VVSFASGLVARTVGSVAAGLVSVVSAMLTLLICNMKTVLI